MAYLAYNEFQELSKRELADIIFEEQFNRLLPKAVAVLDNVTDHYYQRKDIEQDNSWRAKQFRRALCAQIEYFHDVGATTFEGINKAPQSFTAGRTSVSNASRYNPGGENEAKPMVAEDVFIYLEGTGLLYAGVSLL